MKLRNIGMAIAALGLVAAPVAAESMRSSAPVAGESELEGNTFIFAILGAAAVIAGIIIIADDDNEPVSA